MWGPTFHYVQAEPNSSMVVSFVSELIGVKTDRSTGKAFAIGDPRPQNARGSR
jgi:hypothetical protein